MRRITVFMLSAVVLALCMGQAHASRQLRGARAAASASLAAGRALKQVGDALEKWGRANTERDDGVPHNYATDYSFISGGRYDPAADRTGGVSAGGSSYYGYYGNAASAAYYGDDAAGLPSSADLALARMGASSSTLQARAAARDARFRLRNPYDF